MRETMILIVIIAIIVMGDFCAKKYLNNESNKLVQELSELKEKTIIAKQTNEREEIKNKMEKIYKEWEKTSKIWSIIVVHQELDNIEQALIKAKSNINNGNLENSLQEIETAIFFTEHVKEREEISLKNIF